MKTPTFIFGQVPAIPIFLLLMLSLAVGCSSDGDDEAVSLPGTVPDQLNYEISQDTGVSMTLSQNPLAPDTVTVTSASLRGTFNRLTQAFILSAQQPAVMVVSAGDFLSQLDIDLGNTNFSDYSLHVITTANWVGDDNPTSGEFDMFDDAVRKITMSVISDVNNTGLPGVQITYWPNGVNDPGSSVSVSYNWEELDGLLEVPSAEPYAKIASFAYSLLRFMYEQGSLVILSLEFIGDNGDLIELNPPIVENCDTYPVQKPPSPAVLNPGTSMVSWSDVNNDIGISSGDMFLLDFFECWDDDETDDFDTLFNGGIMFVNYIENQTGNVITRVGFESVGGSGGIDFTGLRITETESTLNSTVIVNAETITLSGGFSMVFTAP